MATQYDITQSVVFRKTTDEFGGLANMSRAYPLRVYRIRAATSEALYQALKFPEFPEIQTLVLNAPKPKAAKLIARDHDAFSRTDWLDVRVAIMAWVLRMKLCQHVATFGKLLDATAERAIVEFSKRDPFWGAAPVSPSVLEGENVLGRLLMGLRNEMRRSEQCLEIVPDPEIPGLKLLGLPIERFQLPRPHDPPPSVTSRELIAWGIPVGKHLGPLVEKCRQLQIEGRLNAQAETKDYLLSLTASWSIWNNELV